MSNGNINDQFNLPPVVDRPPQAHKPAKAKLNTNPYTNERRVWLMLERGPHIPPTGQFFGYTAEVPQNDGTNHRIAREFMLKPGEKAWVPEGLVNVLNDAVESVPIKDTDDRITHYEDRLRFSYRLFVNDPMPEGWVQPDAPLPALDELAEAA